MPRSHWKVKEPLFRGDSAADVTVPTPGASKNLVRHILYLEGAGRESPYLSTSEDREAAAHFAGVNGTIWEVYVAKAQRMKVAHFSRKELLSLLKGRGKGRAEWRSAFEVAQARRYVEEWAEHLLDFSPIPSPEEVRGVVEGLFARRSEGQR